MPNFICDSWYCLIFQKKKKTQKVIWILNGSLLLEEHATKRTKFTPKCLKHRENQDYIFLRSDHQSNTKKFFAKHHENLLGFSRSQNTLK